jgi:glycosyltransferase involved in cell wall biosynthesis
MIGSRGLGTNYGGIEVVLDSLCPRLVSLGYMVDVFGRAGPGGSVLQPGLRSVPAWSFGGKYGETITRSTVALLRSLTGYDIIHFHGLGSGILTALTHLVGQKSVVTVHALDQKRDKWNRVAKTCLATAERTMVRHASAVTVVSEALQRYYVDEYKIRPTLIPNAPKDVVRVAPRPVLRELGLADRRYILFASRLTHEKGCHDLVRAMNAIETDAVLVVAGAALDEDYMAELRGLADPDKVVFAGQRSGLELAELLSHATLFVLPSYIEGMSMALLEALSYGIPCIVSDIPENRSVSGDAAVYFPPRDVAALERVLTGALAASDRGEPPRVKLNSLVNWDDVALKYDEVYRRVSETVGAT